MTLDEARAILESYTIQVDRHDPVRVLDVTSATAPREHLGLYSLLFHEPAWSELSDRVREALRVYVSQWDVGEEHHVD